MRTTWLIISAVFVFWLANPRGTSAQNRPIDLLRNLPALASTSLDRFHLDVYGRGMEGPLSGPTQVVIDGLPVSHTFLGATSWNALPFAVAATDSVSWDPSWRAEPGQAQSDGSIQIRSARPLGRHLYFSISALNETGDPGPARFQQATDRNVDRSGPAIELLATSTGERVHVEAGYRFDEHHMTDPAISNRVWSSYNGTDRPRSRIHAPWVRVDAALGDWTLASLARGRLQRDFRWIPEFGREWPTEEADFSGIVEAKRRLSTFWDTGLQAWGRDLSVSSRPLQMDAPQDIRLQQAGGHIWLRRCDTLRCWRLTAGLRGQETASGPLRVRQFEPSARLGVTSSHVDAAAMLFTRSSTLRMSAPLSATALVTLRMVDTRRAALAILLQAQRTDPETGTSLRSIWREGADFGGFLPDEPDVGITSDPGFSTREQRLEVAVDLTLRQLPGAPGNLIREVRLQGAFRNTKGLTAARRVDQDLERRRFFYRESHISTGLEGRALSASAHVLGTRNVTLWYRYHRMISRGSVRWWQATSGLSPHTIGLTSRLEPVRRIQFSAFLAATSPRSFPDRFDSPLTHRPWLVRTELSATKQLFGDAAAATLTVLNVVDAPLTLHPDAGNEQLAARIHVMITL